MPPLPEAIIRVLDSFAPLFSDRVWPHAQRCSGGDSRPGARTVTAALRVMGLAGRAPLHELSSGLEPSDVVGAPGESDAAEGC